MAVVVVEDSREAEEVLQEEEEVSEVEVLQDAVEDFPHEVVVVEASEAEEEDSSFILLLLYVLFIQLGPLMLSNETVFPHYNTEFEKESKESISIRIRLMINTFNNELCFDLIYIFPTHNHAPAFSNEVREKKVNLSCK